MYSDLKIDTLLGKILTECVNNDGVEIIFKTSEGETYKLYHCQDCCESVSIDDINGDLKDLVGSPITLAEESISTENPAGVSKEYQDSFLWTFYRLGTVKGYVDIRWYGESNGYYSESVDFTKVDNS